MMDDDPLAALGSPKPTVAAAAAPRPKAIAAPKKKGVVDSKAKAKKPARGGSQLAEI